MPGLNNGPVFPLFAKKNRKGHMFSDLPHKVAQTAGTCSRPDANSHWVQTCAGRLSPEGRGCQSRGIATAYPQLWLGLGVSGEGSARGRLLRGDTQLTGLVFISPTPGILTRYTSWHCTWWSAEPGFGVRHHWDRQGRTVPFIRTFRPVSQPCVASKPAQLRSVDSPPRGPSHAQPVFWFLSTSHVASSFLKGSFLRAHLVI